MKATKELSIEQAATVLGVTAQTVAANVPDRSPAALREVLDQRQEKVNGYYRRLAEVDKKDRYTYGEVGHIFGVSRQAVHQWENSPRSYGEIVDRIEAELREIEAGRQILEALTQ